MKIKCDHLDWRALLQETKRRSAARPVIEKNRNERLLIVDIAHCWWNIETKQKPKAVVYRTSLSSNISKYITIYRD